MPWLRYKRWRYVTPLAPHVAICASGRRYVWDGGHEGALHVPFKPDLEDLLNPIGDLQSEYEVLWEKYGVAFDEHGKETVPTVPLILSDVATANDLANKEEDGKDETSRGPSPRRGRPRKHR